jgi:hypothetical protein
MGFQISAMTDQVGSTAQQIAGSAHFVGVHISQWEISPSHQCGNLVGIYAVILGFAAVNGTHVQGMPKDELDTLVLTEISHPVPAVHTLNTEHQIVQEGFYQTQQGFWAGRNLFV